jgi:LysM repeat protein
MPNLTSPPTITSTLEAGLWGLHQICVGETLYEISQIYDTPLQTITDLNSIENPDQIPIGMFLLVPYNHVSLTMPNFVTYNLSTNDLITLSSLASEFSTTVSAIQAVNNLSDPNSIDSDTELKIPIGLSPTLKFNDCPDVIVGVLNQKFGAYFRSYPDPTTTQMSQVVAYGTPLQILGKNPGTDDELWYKAIARIRTGGYQTGWLRARWVTLDSGYSFSQIPYVSSLDK